MSLARLSFVGLAAIAKASYLGNFALQFNPDHGDILRVPHESSMQGPLIDSFTVEMWLLAQPRASRPRSVWRLSSPSGPVSSTRSVAWTRKDCRLRQSFAAVASSGAIRPMCEKRFLLD